MFDRTTVVIFSPFFKNCYGPMSILLCVFAFHLTKSFKSDAVADEANLGTVGISGSNVLMLKSKFVALLAFPRLIPIQSLRKYFISGSIIKTDNKTYRSTSLLFIHI